MPLNLSCHLSCQKCKKAGFTMSEVLITLGIIGIVAAMTLPSIINKAEKMILKNQFKKTYSTLTQALLKSEADYGSTPECYYLIEGDLSTYNIIDNNVYSECEPFSKVFLKNLNIVAKCEKNAYPSCIPKYKGFDTIAKDNNTDLTDDEAQNQTVDQNGFWQERILYTSPAYVLADGNIILHYIDLHSGFPKIFAVDINGKKGPNKWGYDLFSFFTVSNRKANLTIVGTWYSVEKGGMTTKEMIKSLYDDKK